MAIKQNISIGRIEQIVAETEDGVKYIPVVLVSGETDTTPEVSVANFPAVQNVQLSGSYVGYSTDDKGDIAPNPNRGDTFIELDTKLIYFFDGSQWVVW